MKIRYPLLIDGGLSNELERQGHDLNHGLWTAKLLEENPAAILRAHLAYLESGAQCITTSSYQASLAGLMAHGHDRASAEALISKSVQLAEDAVERFMASGFRGDRPLVAASVGPYGAYLADGSEYRGDYGVTDGELTAFHRTRIRILDQSNADMLACETIPCYQEAVVLSELLGETRKPAWVSFSCRDEGHACDGSPIGDCVAMFANHPKVFAVGVNCTAPRHVAGLIGSIKARSGSKKIVVYPNSGEVYRADSKSWVGLSDPDAFTAMAHEWLELGADIVGGCCRIGPGHIASLGKRFRQAGWMPG